MNCCFSDSLLTAAAAAAAAAVLSLASIAAVKNQSQKKENTTATIFCLKKRFQTFLFPLFFVSRQKAHYLSKKYNICVCVSILHSCLTRGAEEASCFKFAFSSSPPPPSKNLAPSEKLSEQLLGLDNWSWKKSEKQLEPSWRRKPGRVRERESITSWAERQAATTTTAATTVARSRLVPPSCFCLLLLFSLSFSFFIPSSLLPSSSSSSPLSAWVPFKKKQETQLWLLLRPLLLLSRFPPRSGSIFSFRTDLQENGGKKRPVKSLELSLSSEVGPAGCCCCCCWWWCRYCCWDVSSLRSRERGGKAPGKGRGKRGGREPLLNGLVATNGWRCPSWKCLDVKLNLKSIVLAGDREGNFFFCQPVESKELISILESWLLFWLKI